MGSFKDVLRTFLRLRVDQETLLFCNLYVLNDKHEIKVKKNVKITQIIEDQVLPIKQCTLRSLGGHSMFL